jgi:hypothetical protein
MKPLRQRWRELIGAPGRLRVGTRGLWASFPTRDAAQADYRFWDRARRGRAKGLELSGLFLKPLGSKVAAWVLGAKPVLTPAALDTWWAANHAAILRGYEEALHLGDCFLIVNGDLSVSVVPPHVVEPLLDNEGRALGWRITEIYQGAEQTTIIDEYTAEARTRTIKRGMSVKTEVYPNLTGCIPVIHIANRMGADEVFGRPEGEALVAALQRYGDVFDAALKGNIRQGRPTPVIEKMGSAEQVQKFWERFGRTETTTLPDGTTEAVEVIDFDPDQLLTLGGEATFAYKAPGSFSGDTQTLLNLIFYLVIEHSELPEFAWGGAISSSKASAETQMPPFVKFIEKKRGAAEGWMRDLARVALAYLRMVEPELRHDTQVDNADLSIAWPALTERDGRLLLDTLSWAHGAGLVDDAGARKAISGQLSAVS